MFRNSYNSGGSFVHSKNSTWRWWNVFIGVFLALSVGGAGQTAPAQAAPAGALVFASMKVQNPIAKFCPGETVTYVVQVEFQQIYQVDNPPSLPGVNIKVDAASQNESVGYFVNAVKGTDISWTTVLSADADEYGLGANFKFKAKNIGKTTLYFQGLVEGKYVSVNLPVEVVQCKYKVKLVWKHSDVIYHTTGSSNLVLMTRNESGTEPTSAFSGSGTMHWVYAYVDKTCKQRAKAYASPVELHGYLDDDAGKFAVTVTFSESTIPSSVDCPSSSAAAERKGTLDPLTFEIDASGGTFPKSLAGGTVTITVVAVDK